MNATTPYRSTLGKAASHALAYLDGLDDAPVGPEASLKTLRNRLDRPLEAQGTPAGQVIDELVADVEGGLTGSAGGRFFAWVVGGTLPAALGADWLVSTWDQNASIYAASPAEAVIEETVGRWLKEVLRLPATASFALTTGCQMAHVTCLAAARHAVLSRLGWDVETQGLAGAPPIRVLSSQQHGSIDRALRYLGIGTNSITQLERDNMGSVRRESLEAALQSFQGQPIILLLSAGEINTGSYDTFPESIPVAHAYGAWVHVDGAFGLWVNASEKLRDLLEGAEAADSWATDGHKWLNVPQECGFAFVADPVPHHAAMSLSASYIPHSGIAREALDWNPEWSRRGRCVPTYAALRELGREGLAELVERCCRHANTLVTGIGNLKGAEIVKRSRINQGLVRFRNPSPTATESDHDAFTDRIIAGIVKTGVAYFAGTTWQGKRCMRVSVCNWRTDDADVAATLAAVRRVLEEAVTREPLEARPRSGEIAMPFHKPTLA